MITIWNLDKVEVLFAGGKIHPRAEQPVFFGVVISPGIKGARAIHLWEAYAVAQKGYYVSILTRDGGQVIEVQGATLHLGLEVASAVRML